MFVGMPARQQSNNRHMKKTYTLILTLFMGFSLLAQSPFSLSSQKNDDISVSFVLPDWNFETVKVRGLDNASVIDIQGCGISFEEGKPELPVFSTSVRIDRNSPIIEIVESDFVEYENVIIAPSPGPGERANKERKRKADTESYSLNKFYPENIINASAPFTFRSQNGVSINFNPFQYNPATKTLRVYNHIEVRVKESGDRIKAMAQNCNREFETLYNDMFVNPQMMDNKGNDAPRMMIVAPKEYQSAVAPFVKWKNQRGIDAFVVDADMFSDPFELRDFVREQYIVNGLMFLVLVGDADKLPTFTVENGYSDMMYGYLEGDDHYPDVFVGRISANNPYDIASQLQRFVDYEKEPFTEKDWFSNVLGIASKSGPGHNDEMDYEHIRNIQDKLQSYTYREREECFDGSQGGQDKDGNVYTEDVIDYINDGTGLIVYTGHGEKDSWMTSALGTNHINELRNENMLPLVISAACHTGNFVDGDCLAEAMMNGNNNGVEVGAIGALMSTGSISWVIPMEGQDKMIDIITEGNFTTTFGSIAVGGCARMNEIYFWAGDKITDTWVLFGDPSLEFRSTYPADLEVLHDNNISFQTSSIPVKVIAKQAVATLSLDGVLITSVVVENGETNINVDGMLENNKTYDIVVTAPNRVPYISTITTMELPGRVTDPVPANGTNMASFYPSFQWNCEGSCDGVSYKFSLGTDNPPSNIIDGRIVNGDDIHPEIFLQQNATYYWCVDAVFGSEVTEGEVWSFTTLPEPDEDFEHYYDDGKMSPVNVGDPAWLIDHSNPFRGEYSAHTTHVTEGGECVMEVSCQLDSDDFVGFWVMKNDSAEEGLLQFIVNDEVVAQWNDASEWTWVEHALEAGEYTLKWKYVSLSGSRAGAGAWIDDIFIPGNRKVYAYAGDDATVCLQDNPMPEAFASSYTRVIWSSDGDGGFDNSRTLKPHYYPGPLDLAKGSVELSLSVFNEKTNTEFTDSVTIFFARPPDVKIKVKSQ